MKIYKIPVTWEVYGFVEVEAETAQEALKLANEKEASDNSFDLPTDSDYVENSFAIEQDLHIIKIHNE